MARAQCPHCGASLSGTHAEIMSHIGAAAVEPKPRRPGSEKPKPPRVIPPIKGEMPELPWRLEVPKQIEGQNNSQYAHWTVYAVQGRLVHASALRPP